MIGTHQRSASIQAKGQRSWRMRVVIATSLMCLLVGCAFGTSQAPPGSGEPTASRRPTPSTRHLEPRQAERIPMVMKPLIQHVNHPLSANPFSIVIFFEPSSLGKENKFETPENNIQGDYRDALREWMDRGKWLGPRPRQHHGFRKGSLKQPEYSRGNHHSKRCKYRCAGRNRYYGCVG